MPTATEPIDPGLVLEKLERLKSGIVSVIAGEDELARSRKERMTAVRRELMKREENESAALAAKLGELAARTRDATEAAQAAFQQRQIHIQRAYHASRATLAARVQETKDRRIGRVQGAILHSRKLRQQELAEATAAHHKFQKQLSEDRAIRHDARESALDAFRPFRPLFRIWFEKHRVEIPAEDSERTPAEWRAASLEQIESAMDGSAKARRFPPAMVFRVIPVWLLAAAIAAVFGFRRDWEQLLIAEGVLLSIWLFALVLSLSPARRIVKALSTARSTAAAAERMSTASVRLLAAGIQREEEEHGSDLSETFRETDEESKARIHEGRRKLEAQLARLPAKAEKIHLRNLARIAGQNDRNVELARRQADDQAKTRELSRSTVGKAVDSGIGAEIARLVVPWQEEVLTPRDELRVLAESSLARFPEWNTANCAAWTPPAVVSQSVRIGSLEVNMEKLAGALPVDPRLALAGPTVFQVPLSLGFPDRGSLLIESDGNSAAVLHAISLRLLAAFPPGRATFTFIDPVGLGKDFAGLMHLADYEESLITRRVWTQVTQIEERLAEINEHIEKVIQMYLRNEFANLAEYNEQAGTIAEKYRFVVISGFPSGFSDTAAKRLLSIASSGARCGVHLLIHRDLRQPSPDAALGDELRRACLRVMADGTFLLAGAPTGADQVRFDAPPVNEDVTTLVHRIGKASVDSNRVEVPFSQIAPASGDWWTLDTTDELRVPVGRTGAKKLQMLALGKGTRQHMLVAGKTGSGKSTLFHVIITNLALWCGPDEVEFYLVDFKKGVEFRCYAEKKLPHARVIAIESDREFALSVLQRVDAELKRRGELFRRAGAQDLPGYKRSAEKRPLPRCLLLIDEFQEFFTEDDAVAQEASLLLDRIVRQGRAFGIHVILGSQTLGGAYTLARATLGQMAVRVALQCSEADAQLIMDEENPAPRLLTRPGEGIYNDQSGTLAANSPFQIVWLPEKERDSLLDRVNVLASRDGKIPPVPVIFEGNAPAEVRDNAGFARLLRERPVSRPAAARAWLGAPNSIKGPTEVLFERQSGSHLLVTGQSAERSMSLLLISTLSLAAQYPADQAEFVILDAAEDDPLHRLPSSLQHRVRVGGPAEAPALMADLAATLESRATTSGRGEPEIFLIIRDLHRFKCLRPEDEFRFSMDDDTGASPSRTFADLLGEGGTRGIHVLAATDTWNNVSRWIPRKLLAEFEMRVLFQMSANDSSNLIDSPAASTLGLHRALLHNENQGTAETFRPYAMPDEMWLKEISTGDSPLAR